MSFFFFLGWGGGVQQSQGESFQKERTDNRLGHVYIKKRIKKPIIRFSVTSYRHTVWFPVSKSHVYGVISIDLDVVLSGGSIKVTRQKYSALLPTRVSFLAEIQAHP